MKTVILLAALTCSLWGQQYPSSTIGPCKKEADCKSKPAKKKAVKVSIGVTSDAIGCAIPLPDGSLKPVPCSDSNALDVPAIQETRRFDMKSGCDVGFYLAVDKSDAYHCEHWTCKDKHNYQLQTSEDGQKHNCHRLP